MTGVLAWIWAVTPALALVSATGYVRVVPNTAQLAYLGAHRAALISTVAQAAAVTSPSSVAIRLVAGPVGWAALGVSVGLALMQIHYSQPELAAVKTAASPPGAMVKADGSALGWTALTAGSCLWSACTVGQTQASVPVPNGKPIQNCGNPSTAPAYAGWTSAEQWQCPAGGCGCFWSWLMTYNGANGNNLARPTLTEPTPQQVTDYLTGLAPTSPNSVEANTQSLGQGVSPQSAASETSTAVSPTDLPTTVKPVGQVAPTDAVVDPNAPKPSGTESVPATQTTTSTTTTTTNPDGSTTEATQESASVSCSGNEHDARSFGSILQTHFTTWQGSGLLSALSILQTLTWPETLPTITFSSTTWGTHQVDFNQWAAVFTVLRTLTIAGAGFAAYRIIFVGGS